MKRAKSSKPSRSAAVRAIGYEQPSLNDRIVLAEFRKACKRGEVVALGRTQRKLIESRPEVQAGEPVIRGTRIPARLIADLMRQGVSRTKLRSEYELTSEQIAAAVLFDRITPRLPRRSIRKLDVKTYFAERARRASIPKALEILKRAGVGNPPMKGDELRPRRKQTRTK